MLELFRNASPSRQVALVAAGAALLTGLLVAVWLMFLRVDYGVLFSQLRVADAATIVAELDSKKIPYRLDQGGTTILVPSEQVDGTRLAVMSDDLPLKGQVGFELFDKSDMGLTDFTQKINYQRALQGELARTIMTVESIETARVHLAIGEHSIFRDDRVPPKASVTIVPRAGHRVTMQTVQGIQRLVAAAVPELEPDNVVVIDETGRVVPSDLNRSQTFETPEQQEVEERYVGEVRRAIAGIVPSDAKVAVWAGLGALSPGAASPVTASPGATPDSQPSARNYPLRVTIAVPGLLPAETEQQLKAATLAALAPGAPGDAVLVTVAPPISSQGDAANMAASSTLPPASSETPSPAPVRDVGGLALRAGGAAALIILLIVVLVRLFRSRALSEAERAQYVARFRSLLDQEEANV